MKITLEYTTLKVTVESKDIESTIDAVFIGSKIIETFYTYFQYGKPKFSVELDKFDKRINFKKRKATH